MTDISKCTSTACKLKDECYRYTMPDVQLQSYADFYEAFGDECEAYIPIKWEPKGAN